MKPYPNHYFSGDGAQETDVDETISTGSSGRVDDVVNVSGHRLSTAEIEAALILHESLPECAVVGYADELSGSSSCRLCFIEI